MKFKLVVIDLELSARAKRIIAAVVVPLLVLGGGAVAYADMMHVWKDGEVLNAADLNGNFTSLDARIATIDAKPAPLTAGADVSVTDTIVGGPVNPASTAMMWQSATTTTITDASGIATVAYPSPFPNGVLSVVVTDGFSDFGTLVYGLKGAGVAQTKSSFAVIVRQGNGAPTTNSQVRVNWIAIGW